MSATQYITINWNYDDVGLNDTLWDFLLLLEYNGL